MGKHKKEKVDIVQINTKRFDPNTGLIDAGSIAEYKSAYTQYKKLHGDNNANSNLVEFITTRQHKSVDEQKKKRKRDITSVALSTAAGTMVPFSGIPIMVSATMVQCVGFSASLGLIPIANVRSFQDAETLAKQLTATLKKASTSGMKAAIEAFVLEALKVAGLGTWLWEEILKDIVYELTAGVVTDAVWVITPLFAAPKYILHRKLIKKMYANLGEKAIVVHKFWVEGHLFGVADVQSSQIATGAAAAAIPQVTQHAGFPSAYPFGYPTTGRPQYESNAPQAAIAYPVYYQPAFSASAVAEKPHEQHPHLHGSLSFPLTHEQSQYAHYPASYPMPAREFNSSHGQNYSQALPGGYPPQLSHSQSQTLHLPSQGSHGSYPRHSQAPQAGHQGDPQVPQGGYDPQNGQYNTPYNPGAQNYSQAPNGQYHPQQAPNYAQAPQAGYQYPQGQNVHVQPQPRPQGGYNPVADYLSAPSHTQGYPPNPPSGQSQPGYSQVPPHSQRLQLPPPNQTHSQDRQPQQSYGAQHASYSQDPHRYQDPPRQQQPESC